jgi:hypothetical protein
MADAPSSEESAARMERLRGEISEARRRLATLRHEGERHFIDDQPVSPELTAALEGVVRKGDELAALRAMRTGEDTAVNLPLDQHIPDEHLADLEGRIQRLRQVAGDDPHTHERHFIDG